MAHKRRTVLINKPFQLRFSLYVCSWLFALSAAYPIIIYSLYEKLIDYASKDPNGPPIADLQAGREGMIWTLILIQLAFLAITFLISIFVSHRIAGPVYKLGQFIEAIGRGKSDLHLRFRKHDHFHEAAEQFNDMAHGIRLQLSDNAATGRQAAALIERALSHVDPVGRVELEQAKALLQKLETRQP